MRTTVTIDPDTEILLREEARRTGKSFKRVLNEAIRSALGGRRDAEPARVEPLFSRPLPSEFDEANFNELADEWDAEETLREVSVEDGSRSS